MPTGADSGTSKCSSCWRTISPTAFGVDTSGVRIFRRGSANSPFSRLTGAALMPEPPMSTPNACAVSIIFNLSIKVCYGCIRTGTCYGNSQHTQKHARHAQLVRTIAQIAILNRVNISSSVFANDSSHVGRGSDVGRIVNRVIAARWETRGPRCYFSGGIGCHSGSCSSLRESHHPLAI